MPKSSGIGARPKMDAVLKAATDVALEAAQVVAYPRPVGDYVGFAMDAERLGTHYFRSTDPGYVGWCWAVTVARVPRSKHVTVCEVDVIPNKGALLAPAWVPWEERLEPGDVSRSDVLPYQAQDDRLEQGFEDTSVDADEPVIRDLGLGRKRVMSAEGVSAAAKRWYASDQGPGRGRPPKNTCSTCGFLMKMPGSMRVMFGVCANEWAQDDGRVVSLDHACGSHSETDVAHTGTDWPVRPSKVNDFHVETHTMS